PGTTASGSARSWESAPRCAPRTSTRRGPSSSTSWRRPPTGSRPFSPGPRNELRGPLHAVPPPLVPAPGLRVVVAQEGLLHRLRPAGADQRGGGLLRGADPGTGAGRGRGTGGLPAVPGPPGHAPPAVPERGRL